MDYPRKNCEERDGLQAAYRSALDLWTATGGADPDRMHLPTAAAAKHYLDHMATQLIDQRQLHGC
jgi:hypothetical protein